MLRKGRHSIRNMWLIGVCIGLLGLIVTPTALSAEFIDGGEVYRLAAGDAIEDDLYVAAREIHIDGTVQGDLVAAGALVEVNGTVTGDAMLAGAGIVINGEIQDDARLAGASVAVAGTIGDDLLAGGGGDTGGFSFPIAGQPMPQGVRLAEEAQVGGDALLFGGEGEIAGTIDGNLTTGMGSQVLAARVAGDTELHGDTIQVRDTAQVGGMLQYTSDERIAISEGVAADVEFIERTEDRPASPTTVVLNWLLRTILILAGFALAGWLLLRLAPGFLVAPARAIDKQPGRASLLGVLVTLLFIFVPLASALLVFLMILFWGWFPGIVMGLFLFGGLALAWFLSPLVTGLWLGRRLTTALGRDASNLAALLIGVLIIVLLGRIPFVGWFVYLISFILALGAIFVTRRPGGQAIALREIQPSTG